MWWRSLPLILCCAFAIYWFQVRQTAQDIIAYHELIDETTKERTQKALAKQPASQKRTGVQKEIFSDNQTNHIQIISDTSELTLSEDSKNLEIIEELKNIYCLLDDNLSVSAKEGYFTYPSNQFTLVENCHLTHKQNSIDGTTIHIDFANEIITYENPKGSFSEGPLTFQANQLVWNKKQNELCLYENVTIEQEDAFILHSKEGTVTLKEFEPQELILTGDVRLISTKLQDKKSFATADKLTYNPLEKTFLFSSDTKVLFWQEGMNLSASEILIRDNKTVEGRGNVHFNFDLEEQNYIDELFGQYL